MSARSGFPTWRSWLDGMSLDGVKTTHGLRINNSAAVLQAAIDGMGVALGRSVMVRDELAAGRLLRLFGEKGSVPALAYYAVYRPEAEAMPQIAAFRDWLLEEVSGLQRCRSAVSWARHGTPSLYQSRKPCALTIPRSTAPAGSRPQVEASKILPPAASAPETTSSTAGIKMFADGEMTLKSACIREVYADDPHNYGMLATDPAVYKENVRLANRYGWRVGTHVVGDAAVDLALDAYEAADKDKSLKDKRFILIHASLITSEQVRRAKKLGTRIDAQNIFMWDKAATVERFMGPALTNRAVPTKVLLDTLGFEATAAGTDNPVNMLNPFVGMYMPVTRKDSAGVSMVRTRPSRVSRPCACTPTRGPTTPSLRARRARTRSDALRTWW
ncbi:amidohydrolase family protein [Variovorax sp. DAIF25]